MQAKIVKIVYKNYRGEISIRKISLKRFGLVHRSGTKNLDGF